MVAFIMKPGSIDRFYSVAVAWQLWLSAPILGYGWGSITSHDLLVRLLANCGVVGLAGFFGLFYRSYQAGCVARSKADGGKIVTPEACTLVITLLVMFISDFAFYLGIGWIVLGLCWAGGMKCAKESGGMPCGAPQAAQPALRATVLQGSPT